MQVLSRESGRYDFPSYLGVCADSSFEVGLRLRCFGFDRWDGCIALGLLFRILHDPLTGLWISSGSGPPICRTFFLFIPRTKVMVNTCLLLMVAGWILQTLTYCGSETKERLQGPSQATFSIRPCLHGPVPLWLDCAGPSIS